MRVNGAVDITGARIGAPSNSTQGQVFTIIDNDGTDPVIGTFQDLPEGAIFENEGERFVVSYVGGDGNDVTLTVNGSAARWWSNAANWTPNGGPQSGDGLVFPAALGGVRVIANDLAPGLRFEMQVDSNFSVHGNEITIAGVAIGGGGQVFAPLRLVAALEREPAAPMAYGRAWNFVERTGRSHPVFVRAFSERLMAQLCIVSQPATLVRRSAWEAAGGLDEKLHMAMDYDLWWRLYREFGKPAFVDEFLATNREHAQIKTSTQRTRHYREAMDVVRRHYGRVPLKWYLAQPYAVWYRSIVGR